MDDSDEQLDARLEAAAQNLIDRLAAIDPHRLELIDRLSEVDVDAEDEAKVRLWVRVAAAKRQAGLPQTEHDGRYLAVFRGWSDARLKAWRERVETSPFLHGPASSAALRAWEQVVGERARRN